MSPITRIDKSPDDMLKLTEAEIRQYFNDRMVSNAEIKALLEQLDIAPAGRSRGRLAEFAAREISELGVYQRVARGGQHSHR